MRLVGGLRCLASAESGGQGHDGPNYFKITLRTADQRGAGTHANVSVTLHGRERTSPPFALQRAASGLASGAAGARAFERGAVDFFVMMPS